MLYQDLGSVHNMTKLAYGAEGHSKLTGATGQGLKAGPGAQRILTEYAADVADAHGGSGRLADAARGMRERGGLMNLIGARLAETGSSIGTALDKPIMSPYSPAAQSRHAFPGTLEQAAERIRTGRANAGSLLAEAAMAEGPARNRGLVQALAQAGESAHIAQDVKPHTIVAGDFARQAGEGAYGKRLQLSSKAVEKLPQSLRPMAVSGVGHAASGLEGGAAALDDAALISGREMRGAESMVKRFDSPQLRSCDTVTTSQHKKLLGWLTSCLGRTLEWLMRLLGREHTGRVPTRKARKVLASRLKDCCAVWCFVSNKLSTEPSPSLPRACAATSL